MRRLLLVLGAGLLWIAPAALAQDGERPTPAQGGKQASQLPEPKSSWVKLCETPSAPAKDVLGKPQLVGVRSCLTFHERLDATTGMRIVAIGIRQIRERQTLTVIVPASVDRRGMLVFIYPHSVWKRVARGGGLEMHERDMVTTVKLGHASCDAAECATETDASPELIKDLRTKGGLAVNVIVNKQIIPIQASLGGFREAYDGPSVDTARWLKVREDLLRALRERNRQRVPAPPPAPPRGKGDQPQPPPVPPGKGDQRI
jgi:invasion protein IalB